MFQINIKNHYSLFGYWSNYTHFDSLVLVHFAHKTNIGELLHTWFLFWYIALYNIAHGTLSNYEINTLLSLQWRHNSNNKLDVVSNHQPHDCLLNQVFRRRSKETSKLRVTGLCVGNSPVTGEFPTQMASNEENISIWWRHHVSVWVEQLCLPHLIHSLRTTRGAIDLGQYFFR